LESQQHNFNYHNLVYVNRSVIEELIQKSEYVEWKNKERVNHYAVVSKTGFTADAKRFAEKNGVHTFTLSSAKLGMVVRV